VPTHQESTGYSTASPNKVMIMERRDRRAAGRQHDVAGVQVHMQDLPTRAKPAQECAIRYRRSTRPPSIA
jgi:hypothetical protein